jgi:hypothetical protein
MKAAVVLCLIVLAHGYGHSLVGQACHTDNDCEPVDVGFVWCSDYGFCRSQFTGPGNRRQDMPNGRGCFFNTDCQPPSLYGWHAECRGHKCVHVSDRMYY